MSAAQDPAHPDRSQVMILCAGLGTRMRPLTLELPKPLMPVGDRSALAHLCARLVESGHAHAVANTHWLPDQFSRAVHELPLTLGLVHEPQIRGVAGGISGARHLLEAPLLGCNGDIVMWQPPLGALLQWAGGNDGVCLAVSPSRGLGSVGLDEQGRVVRLRGEVHGVEARSADYVGMFGLGPSAFRDLPELGCLIGDVCLPRLRQGLEVSTCPAPAEWWDIGSPAGYLGANRAWLERHANHASSSYVHPSARISSGVCLENSVVGAGAIVTGGGLLSGSVIWPGARAEAPLNDAIVSPKATVLAGAPA